MKKIKKVRSLLLALLLLSFSAFANFINVYADTVDDIVTDESVVEPMDSFEGAYGASQRPVLRSKTAEMRS